MTARFIVGDVFDVLATLPDQSVDCIVTSPPFLALRSYLPADHPDKAKEIGAEPTPAAFLDTLLDLTAELRRVLTPHGSICVELGDTYAGSGGRGGDYLPGGLREGQPGFGGSAERQRAGNAAHWRQKNAQRGAWPLDKSLTGIPTLYAWSLAYGRNLLNPEHIIEPWRVRNLIAWCRPNPPVGALGDKVRPASSYVTVACMDRKRYFDLDAERTPLTEPGAVKSHSTEQRNHSAGWKSNSASIVQNPAGAPLLDWWAIPTQPYAGAHYATFPEELPRRLISLMCPQKVCQECGEPSRRIVDVTHEANRSTNGPQSIERRHLEGGSAGFGVRADRVTETLGWTDCGHDAWRPGIVLDPFAGSGTTLAVAVGMGRQAIGIDLDERNALLAEQRVGMFLTVDDGTPLAGVRTETVVNL